ncbi:hypothetical protein NECAME_15284 [Necator americanus]|uniref:Uncharacterized protein n=1 Tax=Necator americanus TaxID=51031 RepID=W2SII4_NECAM|nr:hypothetical protein NECAME_15284 [Necator americanus]ETN69464.1 hypothetical protein NECAME_15284 [Necator americanus]
MRRWLWWLTAAATLAALLAQHYTPVDSLLQQHDRHDCPERCPQCREPQCGNTVLDQCGCCPVLTRFDLYGPGPESGNNFDLSIG